MLRGDKRVSRLTVDVWSVLTGHRIEIVNRPIGGCLCHKRLGHGRRPSIISSIAPC